MDRVFHSSAASGALYILLPDGGNRWIREAFTIIVHPMLCSGLVSMWRKFDCFQKK
jgi:hypothetical protein